MDVIKDIWKPIEIYTLERRILLIELQKTYNNIIIDHTWDKILGDGDILFEFNPGESKEYSLIGTYKQCYEDPTLLNNVLDILPKYDEVWDIPSNDPDGWEKIEFIDDNGRQYKQRGRELKYRRRSGEQYINYGIPLDVMEYFPLNSAQDSFVTLLRKYGIFMSNNDYIILKDLIYGQTEH